MPITRDKKNNCWRFEFDRRIPGAGRVRARKRLPSTWSLAQADAFDRKESARLYALATGAERPQAGIEDAVACYAKERLPELKSAKRIAQELALIHWAYKGRTLAQLPEVCVAIRARYDGKLKPATVRNRLRYLTSACRWGWKVHDMCAHDPAARVMMPKVDNARQVYTDRATVLRAARWMGQQGERDSAVGHLARRVILVAFYSGMRLDEQLRAAPSDAGWSLSDTKNGQPRIVPIHPRVAHLARAWPPCKVDKKGRRAPIKARTVQGWWAQARDALKLGDLHLHDLRHSTASEMINAGEDLYTVGAVLGHKSPQSTKRYAHLATRTLATALGKVGKKAA